MRKDELRYKRKIREAYWSAGYWSEAYEPGIGSGTGYPDLQLMCPVTKRLLPVELKIGSVLGGVVYPKEVRGPQTVWHREFWRAGGTSICMIGVEEEKNGWSSYVVEGPRLKDWEAGWKVESVYTIHRLHPRPLSVMVDHFLRAGPLEALALKAESVI